MTPSAKIASVDVRGRRTRLVPRGSRQERSRTNGQRPRTASSPSGPARGKAFAPDLTADALAFLAAARHPGREGPADHRAEPERGTQATEQRTYVRSTKRITGSASGFGAERAREPRSSCEPTCACRKTRSAPRHPTPRSTCWLCGRPAGRRMRDACGDRPPMRSAAPRSPPGQRGQDEANRRSRPEAPVRDEPIGPDRHTRAGQDVEEREDD